MASADEDLIANKVLQECSQDIVDNVNVDLVIMRLHSKSRLTAQDVTRLENTSTPQEKKRQLYLLALADKGSAAFEDIVAILSDTALKFQPHTDLADKLRKRYKYLLSQHSNRHGETQEDKTTVTKMRTETVMDDSESRHSDNGNDIDHLSDSEQCDDQSQLLADGRADDIQASYQSRMSHVQEKQEFSASNIDTRLGHSVDVEASSSTAYGYQSSVESSRRVLKSSSSFQSTSDRMACQTPSSVKSPGLSNIESRPGSRMDRSCFVASNVTKESRFIDSFTRTKSTILIKSLSPLPKMIPIKLILLGDGRVGKTSLAQRFLHDVFYDESPGTVGNKHDQYYFQHVQKRINVKLSIWDTAGDGRYSAMSPMYYRDAHVAMVVFDMTDIKSLYSVNNWKTQVIRRSSRKDDINIPILLVGNKCDIPDGSNETRRRAQGIAENFDDFIEASAKDDFNVETIFEKAISLALKNYIPHGDAGISLNRRQQQQQNSLCC